MRLKSFIHNNWVEGTRITETVLLDGKRRFTATIRGFQNWKFGEYEPNENLGNQIQGYVQEIRDRIDSGDDTVFYCFSLLNHPNEGRDEG